jgi:uncharacterized protein YeaO (DUF488 family)
MPDTDQALFEEALSGEPAASAPATDESVLTETPEPQPEGEQPRDEHGRFAPRADGEQPAAEEEQPQQERVVHSVPLNELLAVRDRAQAAERERDEYRRRVEERDRREQQAEAARRQQVPDMLTQPQQYHAYVMQQFRQELQAEREAARAGVVDISMRMQHRQHGDAFVQAYQSLQSEYQRGNVQLRNWVVNSPDPGEALMTWWADVSARQEIGNDFAGFKQRYREQLKADPAFQKELADFIRGRQAQAAQASRGNGVVRNRPGLRSIPSLTRATGAADSDDRAEESEAGLLTSALRRG